jgi:hypothetical protein
MMSLSQPFVRFPLLLVLLVYLWWVAKTGLAGIYSFQAGSYFELWQHQRSLNPTYSVTESQFTQIEQQHHTILSLIPYNGDYWSNIAQLQLWYLANTPQIPLTQQQQLKTAILSDYRTALRLRPTWPYTYADFAKTKAMFGDYDAEFLDALNKANRLGAHESDIIRLTIELGLILWDKLPAASKALVANAVERASTWQLNERLNQQERIFALSLVGHYQKTAEICALMSPIGKKSANCS